VAQKAASNAGLRFDKVAIRLVERVRDAVRQSVPDGKMVVFTVTAPIRLPSKTAAALEEQIKDALTRRSARIEFEDRIHGNDVRVWVVTTKSRTQKVLGYVHNPDVDPERLLDLALGHASR
jgi:hypothetical protein